MSLFEDIKQFFTMNEESKKLKKLLEPLNDSIKDQFKEKFGLKEGDSKELVTDEGIIALFQSQEKSSLNQSRLLEKLKNLGYDECIKNIEVVDAEKLENLIYEGVISAAELDDCRDTSYVEKLTVKPPKKAKETKSKKKAEEKPNESKRNSDNEIDHF